MPGMDGFQLADEIRKNPKLCCTAILMLTSAGQRGDAARCRETGLEGYLTKPVSQSELLDTVLLVAGSKRLEAMPVLVTRHSLQEVRRFNTSLIGRVVVEIGFRVVRPALY